MSTYYEYEGTKRNLYAALTLNGWKCYGYRADQSDMMTDYYSPASWEGIATKNGYILCIDIKKYNVEWYSGKEIIETVKHVQSNIDKVNKLNAIINDKAATNGEKQNAKELLTKIQEKEQKEIEESRQVVDTYPIFQENPNRCNWHIEKDGKIFDKGAGLLKFVRMPYSWDYQKKELKKYRDYQGNENSLTEKEEKLVKAFYALIDRFEKVVAIKCGNENIKDDIDSGYEKVEKTEYKIEYKAEAIDFDLDYLRIGVTFVLNTSFNYGCSKGYVYQITKMDTDNNSFYSNRFNRKLTKILEGYSDSSNHMSFTLEKFKKYIEKGSISICRIIEVKTPYKVEKYIKKVSKKTNNTNTTTDKTIYWIKVYNSYEIRKALKDQKYKYYRVDQCWYKNTTDYEKELENINIDGIKECDIEIVDKSSNEIIKSIKNENKAVLENLLEKSTNKIEELNIVGEFHLNTDYKDWLFEELKQFNKKDLQYIHKNLEYKDLKDLIAEYIIYSL